MNSLLLLVNLLGLAIMVTLFHRSVGRPAENERERKRWRSARESDYVRARRGVEIRCCVKYNTYFTTEIPIPSTRTEIHREGRLSSTSFLLETFFGRNDILFGLHSVYRCTYIYGRIVENDYGIIFRNIRFPTLQLMQSWIKTIDISHIYTYFKITLNNYSFNIWR